MNLAPLKYLLLIENGATIFRNYLCLKKRRTRVIVVCWMVFTVSNLLFNAVVNIKLKTSLHFHAQEIYYFSSCGFSIYVMIASLYYSKSFYRLLLNFDAFYEIFDDNVYYRKMLKAQKVLTLKIMSFCCIKIIAFTYARVANMNKIFNVVFSALSQFNISMCDFRYLFEYFMLRSIIFVLSEQLRAITRSIDRELSAMRENRWNIEHGVSNIAVNYDKVCKWMKAYENINDSSNLFNSMFSIQLTIMLIVVVTIYIILIYTIAIITVQHVEPFIILVMNLISMVVFLMALFVISRGGQKIQNSSMELQQKLCEFGLHTLESEEYYKLTKDLLRFVRTRPVRVNVFGILDVNMSMLPSIVALFTTYSVIALQFNNVL